MDPAALAGLCLLLAQGRTLAPLPDGVVCPPARTLPVNPSATPTPTLASLAVVVAAPGARDGIARVAYAEAGNQGDSGLAAVVYTILNRLQDGRWGASVDAVLNARSQFEPVLRAGGDWRALPAVSPTVQARIDTILDLALDGRLPDLTNGARYFQNPAIVAKRAQAGQVSASLVNFGGQAPSAVIGAHRFYTGQGRGGGPRAPAAMTSGSPAPGSLFVGENRADVLGGGPAPIASDEVPDSTREIGSGDPSHALFVLHSGQVRAAQP